MQSKPNPEQIELDHIIASIGKLVGEKGELGTEIGRSSPKKMLTTWAIAGFVAAGTVAIAASIFGFFFKKDPCPVGYSCRFFPQSNDLPYATSSA
jgi:hypothetical protein